MTTTLCNILQNYDIDQVAGFEGPEKRLFIEFKINDQKPLGFREYGREQWQSILDHAKCTIISQTSNKAFDSYVLSESSLFVYPYKVVLKTCGTTTLLKTVPPLLELAKNYDSKPELVVFSRKNYNFPARQPTPHHQFDAETDYLNQYFRGNSSILGDPNGDHWHIYVADCAAYDSADRTPRATLEIMMSKLDRKKMNRFYKGELDAKETTVAAGINQLLPGSISDEVLFAPCGYSVNGLLGDAYYTIHVTPEPHCSFVSFETNAALPSYTSLLRRVLDTFRPGEFCMAVFVPRSFPTERLIDIDVPGYALLNHTDEHLEDSFSVSFCSYRATPDAAPLSQ